MGAAQANPATAPAGADAPRGLYAGVDIGGTTISVGLVDEKGVLRGSPKNVAAVGGGGVSPVWWEPLGEDHDPVRVAGRVGRLLEAALAEDGSVLSDVRGVGVCTPGLVDTSVGVVRSAANLKGWQQVPICDILAKALGVGRDSVVLENDTNASLLAEVWIGAAEGRRDVVLMTLGTGVGGSIMCDGRLLRGSKGQAGELGHTIVVPDGRPFGSAGVLGILEGYASASAVAGRASENGGAPETSSLHRGDGAAPPDCAEVFRAAAQGDEHAMSLVRETARYLAIGCVNCCRVVDPDAIIFAGGMAQAGDFLLREVRSQFAAYHWNIEPVRVEFLLATTGAHSGVVGAARAAAIADGKGGM